METTIMLITEPVGGANSVKVLISIIINNYNNKNNSI